MLFRSVVVMDIGDELVTHPEQCAPGQIPASNGAMLAAMALPTASTVHNIGPVPDTLEDLLRALDERSDADVIVTSGGASVGDHDLVKPALEAWGASLKFWRVAIRPGKPILVATRTLGDRQQIILGLPGNPVSSYVTAHLFMLPFLRSLAGCAQPLPGQFPATLQSDVSKNGIRQTFMRGLWDGVGVRPLPNQDSSSIASLATSNVLIDRPAHAPAANAGDAVSVYWIGNVGIA